MSPEESRQDEIIEKLTKENESLRQRLEKAEKENERLRKLLEEALRSLKRQAAPFSKGKPKSDPKRPGRKKGLDYGPRAFRAVPDHVDEEIPVPLPKKCPDCGGRVIHDDTQPQYQEDIIRRTSSGASMWRRVIAADAVDMFKADTPCKRPMLWERHTYKWVRRH